MKKKVFISGPITTDPDYKHHFQEAEDKLTKEGYFVLSPTKCVPEDLAYEDQMAICFCLIDISDEVCFLKNWHESNGACREYAYSDAKRKGCFYYETGKKL